MIDRKKMRENLQKRSEESAARGEGDNNQKYFRSKDESTIPLWKARPTKKDEVHIIDIIPFIAGDNFPLDGGRKIVRKGDDAYVLNLAVHQNVGALKEMIVCPARNYGKPCPICEDFDKRSRAGEEWDTLKDISPKDRSVYNIVVMTDSKTEAKGVQIWEVSYRQSEKSILAIAKNPRGGGYIPFQHPDKGVGKSIAFEVDDDAYWTPRGHRFVERSYDIPDEILEQAHTLDELIVILPYEKIKEKYYGKVDDVPNYLEEEKQEEKTHIARRRPVQEEKKEVKADECPFGGEFGISIDRLGDHCSKDCPDEKYQACAERADEIEEEKKKEAAKKSGAWKKIRLNQYA